MLVVASEHHLSTDLQTKLQLHGETLLLKVAVHCTLVHELLCFNLFQSLKVDLVGSLVDGCQCDDRTILLAWRVYTGIKVHDVFWCHLVHAHVFQDVKEVLIILTIHLLELDLYESHTLDGIRFVEEKVVCVVEILQKVFLWPLLHHRRQLEHIANEDHLLASERHVVPECLTHGVVDGIHHVTSHHRYLIDDDGICMEKGKDSCLIHLSASSWSTNLHRKTEERVNGITTGKDGCHTCWCKGDELLPHQFLHVVEEGCLTCTSTSCEKEAGVCVGNKLVCKLLLVVLCVYLCVLHVLLLFDLWEDLGETCVEVAIKEALVATLNDTLGLCFKLFLWHG